MRWPHRDLADPITAQSNADNSGSEPISRGCQGWYHPWNGRRWQRRRFRGHRQNGQYSNHLFAVVTYRNILPFPDLTEIVS